MKMMERKAYTAFGEMGFGETGRHSVSTSKYIICIVLQVMFETCRGKSFILVYPKLF